MTWPVTRGISLGMGEPLKDSKGPLSRVVNLKGFGNNRESGSCQPPSHRGLRRVFWNRRLRDLATCCCTPDLAGEQPVAGGDRFWCRRVRDPAPDDGWF